MQASVSSAPGRAGQRNDDWAAVSADGVAVVLDGLSEGPASGCSHGTGWYVHQLGCRLLMLAGGAKALPDVLGRAIAQVAALHSDRCALDHPGTPAATVALIRRCDDRVDYLVLSDAVVVVDTADAPFVVTDQRVRAHTTPGTSLSGTIAAQQPVRNTPDGYWVAQADPAAAGHAASGTIMGAAGALLLSDGAALAVTDFDALTWRELLDLAYDRGPAELIAVTRELAARDPDRVLWPRLKTHDDATAVICRW